MPSIAALEVPHRFGESRAQLEWIEPNLPEAGLVVLPEACLTGYVAPGGDGDLRPFAEERNGPTERALRALAKRSGRALLAPLIEKSGAEHYNSALFIDANGEVLGAYRKRHPWMLETWATPGGAPPALIEWRGLTLAVAICFDAQFLAEDGKEQLSLADALLFPSAWTEFPPDTREELLRGLALRFGCAIVNANWGRGRPRVPGQGRSLILGSDGALLSEGPVARAELECKVKNS